MSVPVQLLNADRILDQSRSLSIRAEQRLLNAMYRMSESNRDRFARILHEHLREASHATRSQLLQAQSERAQKTAFTELRDLAAERSRTEPLERGDWKMQRSDGTEGADGLSGLTVDESRARGDPAVQVQTGAGPVLHAHSTELQQLADRDLQELTEQERERILLLEQEFDLLQLSGTGRPLDQFVPLESLQSHRDQRPTEPSSLWSRTLSVCILCASF